ncbi:WbqC family protein [Nitratireductor sp. StC3]|uniref:WbqC family protein n=1 Tax=Nitratireductor sp. StC3 TaxID=2126741 RepID=UPI000D0D929D|nr:WbqC family protein [Nitratireductor sp. StC3]PSM18283.1 hypothetical protein C7T96_10465 [Nitratireductor sp. StC3]
MGERPQNDSAPKRLAIVQPCYIPWKGYFDLIGLSDEFVILDDVQYVKNTWYNRNRLKSPAGLKWLTLPVLRSGPSFKPINHVEIDANWAQKHLDFIAQNYRKASYFDDFFQKLEKIYQSAEKNTSLLEIDRVFIDFFCRELAIRTPIVLSSQIGAEGRSSQRVLDICIKRKADIYLSGPAARTYLDLEKFAEAGIAVEWMDYSGYREYPQLHGAFEHAVSIIDLVLNTGPAAAGYLKSGRRAEGVDDTHD